LWRAGGGVKAGGKWLVHAVDRGAKGRRHDLRIEVAEYSGASTVCEQACEALDGLLVMPLPGILAAPDDLLECSPFGHVACGERNTGADDGGEQLARIGRRLQGRSHVALCERSDVVGDGCEQFVLTGEVVGDQPLAAEPGRLADRVERRRLVAAVGQQGDRRPYDLLLTGGGRLRSARAADSRER
jgi:hypothetical protein